MNSGFYDLPFFPIRPNDGVNGKDGVSPTISVEEVSSGHKLIIKDISGAKTVEVLNGKDGLIGADGKDGINGKDGAPGKDGADGKTPYIKDGYWWVGETNTNVKAEGLNGKDGKDGNSGPAGSAGINGKSAYQYAKDDGYTGSELEFAKAINPTNINNSSLDYISTELAKRQQLKPEFVNNIDECTDSSKLYVLPDGLIYGYITKAAQEVFTDVLKDVGYQEHMRINSSGGIVGYDTTESDVTGYIPVKLGDVIRLENIIIPSTYTQSTYWNMVASYTQDKTYIKSYYLAVGAVFEDNPINQLDEDGNVTQFTITTDLIKDEKEIAFIVIDAKDITSESKIYVNSTLIETSGFASTGHAFIPADYENRIIELENKISNTGIDLIPSYWKTELKEKAEAIQIAIENAGRNKSSFLWYTDAHWQTNSKKSPMLLRYLVNNTPINKINFGGDITNDPDPYNHENTRYTYDWRSLIVDLPNHHSVYGNHDVNHRTVDVSKIAYAHLLATEESADMIIGGDSFYYIDNQAEKTRYLYLSYLSNNQDEMIAQGQFIIKAVTSVEAGWHIVVIAHRWFQYTSSSTPTVGAIPTYEQEILNVFDKYNAKTTYTASNYFTAQDFSSCKGKVEFCIGGHIHVDYDFKTAGGIPVIITASDTNQERALEETEDNGTLGTTTESAVFGIIADYNSNKIIVVGIGRGTSREISY